MNVDIFKIGSQNGSVLFVDHVSKRIVKKEIGDARVADINFQGINDDSFGYDALERIFKGYMVRQIKSDASLKEIANKIKEDGFYYGGKPSLRINVESASINDLALDGNDVLIKA